MKALLARILGVTSAVLDFLLPTMRALLRTGLVALLPLALEVVRSLAAKKDIPGSQKFQHAVSALRAEAIAQGIEASTNLIETAVKLAVEKLREGGK
jgi:hypothetical protein